VSVVHASLSLQLSQAVQVALPPRE
jgi:hypothetical protein